jgi:hypothetical protein
MEVERLLGIIQTPLEEPGEEAWARAVLGEALR